MTRKQIDWNSKFEKHLKEMPPKVFNQDTLASFFDELKDNNIIPANLDYSNILKVLLRKRYIKEIEINYIGDANSKKKKYIRYTCNSPSPFAIALSLRSKSYLSHNSALYLNGLIHKMPKHIFVNKEQSAKRNSYELAQSGIDRAFKNKVRQSKYVWKYERYNYIMINGKNTGDYGVTEIILDNGELVHTTNIERTLIDVVVRPIYSGGVENLATIYRNAKGKVSVDTIIKALKRLDYAYPYHQCIGFLMEKTGYPQEDLNKLKQITFNYDFYLDYNMKDTNYDSNWRLHFPKEIKF